MRREFGIQLLMTQNGPRGAHGEAHTAWFRLVADYVGVGVVIGKRVIVNRLSLLVAAIPCRESDEMVPRAIVHSLAPALTNPSEDVSEID